MVLNLAFVYFASFMGLPAVTEQLIIHYKETEEKGGWNLSKAKCFVVFFSLKNGFHRITECSGLAGTSVGHLVQPPAEAGSPRAGCTAPRPGRSGISPEKETPQPPWAACSRAPSPSEGRSSSSWSYKTMGHVLHSSMNMSYSVLNAVGCMILVAV